MRITGGAVKGRRLYGPRGRLLRPTSDKVREALFQILTVRMEKIWPECRVLDLFAGTGALGMEALSRGAMSVVFIDNSSEALKLIKKNLATLGFEDRSMVAALDFLKYRKKFQKFINEREFDLVLADPPYSRGMAEKAMDLIADSGCLAPGGWMVLEEQKGVDLNQKDGSSLRLDHVRCYGQTCIWFFRKAV